MLRPCQRGGGCPMSPVWILKRLVSVFINACRLLSALLSPVAIWPREVVSCRDFILRVVATFWAMSLPGIYPGRASMVVLSNAGWYGPIVHQYSPHSFEVLIVHTRQHLLQNLKKKVENEAVLLTSILRDHMSIIYLNSWYIAWKQLYLFTRVR